MFQSIYWSLSMVFTFLGRLSLTRQCGMVVFLVKWAFNIHSWYGLLVYTKTRKVDKLIMIKPCTSMLVCKIIPEKTADWLVMFFQNNQIFRSILGTSWNVYRGLTYWWWPDTMFTLDNPVLVQFPAFNAAEHAVENYRTMRLG